jgi:hypothetical protein
MLVQRSQGNGTLAMGALMRYDAKELERRISELDAARQKLVQEAAAVKEQFGQHIIDRQGIVAGQLGQAKSPASRLALEGLERSDAALWSATQQIAATGDKLVADAEAWRNSIQRARDALQEAHAGIEAGNADGVAKAAGELARYVESIRRSGPLALDAALLLEYLVLVELHDANAIYLNKKEWNRSKEAEAARTLLEGLGDHAVEVVLTASAGIAGFTPHGWVIVSVLAGGKAIYALTKSQVKEARKKLAGAINDIDKLYVLQQLNEQLTGNAHTVVKLLEDAAATSQAQRTVVLEHAEKLRLAGFAIDDVVAQGAQIQSAEAALRDKKRKSP